MRDLSILLYAILVGYVFMVVPPVAIILFVLGFFIFR